MTSNKLEKSPSHSLLMCASCVSTLCVCVWLTVVCTLLLTHACAFVFLPFLSLPPFHHPQASRVFFRISLLYFQEWSKIRCSKLEVVVVLLLVTFFGSCVLSGCVMCYLPVKFAAAIPSMCEHFGKVGIWMWMCVWSRIGPALFYSLFCVCVAFRSRL